MVLVVGGKQLRATEVAAELDRLGSSLVGVATNVSTLGRYVDAELAELVTTSAARSAAVDDRLEGIEGKLAMLTERQVPKLLAQQEGLVADLRVLTATVNQLRDAVCAAGSADGGRQGAAGL